MPGRSANQAELRRTAWRVSLALLACFWVTVGALHPILQGFGWWFAMAGITLLVLGAAAIARAVSARRWMPTVTSSLVLVGMLTLLFAARSAFLFVIPTFETFGIFGDLGHMGGQSIASQSVPAEVTPGIVFLLFLGSGVLAIIADLIALTWRLPALAAVPLAVVLAIPTFIGIELSDVFVFVLAAIAWLVLLRAGQPFPQTARAMGLGAAAIILALLVPLVMPQVHHPAANNSGFSGYLSGVNPVLKLGDDLRRGLARTILTYSTLSDDPTYLRLVSLQNFTAETWEPDPPEIDKDHLPSEVGPPPGLSADVQVDDETTWVDVKNLGSPWLPVPYPVTLVEGLTGDWFWDAKDLTFTSPDRAARGEGYTAQSLKVEPTPAQLTAAGSVVPGTLGKYLALPDNMPAIIATDAQRVTSQATSDYGKAVALQRFFRGGTFAYSETAPVDQDYDGTGMDVLAKFLEVKSGYCVHFASAMAVMARTLGIPSRVAVGFLPGERQTEKVDGRSVYRVTTQNVHSWPELYFEGIGWTRFEPTPGRGFVPSYADEANPDVPTPPTPSTAPTPTPSPTSTIAPSRSAAPVAPGDTVADAEARSAALGWLWAALIVLGAVILLLVPAFVRGLQRRIRIRRLGRGAPVVDTGWRELLQSAVDLDVGVSPTATPREAARELVALARPRNGGRPVQGAARGARLGAGQGAAQGAERGAVRGARLSAGLDAELNAELESLMEVVVARVERESFSRHSSSKLGPARAGTELADQVLRILHLLRSASGWRVRVSATLAPRSVWRWLVGFSRAD